MAQKPSSNDSIFQLKITLNRSNPPVWRRILVDEDISLEMLHFAIQGSMGWKHCHLFRFIVNGKNYSDPQLDPEIDDLDCRDYLLNEITQAGASFEYLYDFGDDWHHTVQVERIAQADDRYFDKPVCIDGENACPPEDAGGISGYYEKLEILKDPKHPEYKEITKWLRSKTFDPTAFDLKSVNSKLKLMLRLNGNL